MTKPDVKEDPLFQFAAAREKLVASDKRQIKHWQVMASLWAAAALIVLVLTWILPLSSMAILGLSISVFVAIAISCIYNVAAVLYERVTRGSRL